MRYSTSMLAAIGICFITFLGMAFLVSTPKYVKSTQLESINFSKVADMEEPTIKKTPKVKPPERKKVKQPPAAKLLDVTSNSSRPVIPLQELNKNGNTLTLPTKGIPNLLNRDNFGETDANSQMQPMFMIQPMYPPEAVRSKIEGWVEVEFTVNEMGIVTNAKIINSKPRRVFDAVTLKALRKSKFKPLMIDGKAHAQKAIQIIEFKLQD